MKVVILAGGLGTRLGEETSIKPKPMIEIGDKPIIWHIMKTYASFGYKEFIICCGYRGNVIKEYFINYYLETADINFRMSKDEVDYTGYVAEDWKLTLANTGLKTLTAGRILRIRDYIGEEPFFLTYGDGVADVNIDELLRFHRENGKIVTISTTRPEGRFGVIKFDEESGTVERFQEKARQDQGWVNMGFMVMEPSVFPYLEDGSAMLEGKPFESLLADKQIDAYQHEGFWSPMDTIKDKEYLEELWMSGKPPWKVW